MKSSRRLRIRAELGLAGVSVKRGVRVDMAASRLRSRTPDKGRNSYALSRGCAAVSGRRSAGRVV
jgi:hypothetical protein